jgi:pimeloyl-ACP methyl ester carboxylesterase
MWEMIERLHCPITLVRGGTSPVVDDADVAELRRRRADAVLHVVDGAGHSVQGDRPLELAALLQQELAATRP